MQTRTLKVNDVSVGSTVALQRGADDVGKGDGYGTAFFVAEVVSIECAGDDVRRMQVAYRLPLLRGRACDNVKIPWQPACWGGHAYGGMQCELRTDCKKARPKGKSTSRMLETALPAAVFETGIEFTASGTLTMP